MRRALLMSAALLAGSCLVAYGAIVAEDTFDGSQDGWTGGGGDQGGVLGTLTYNAALGTPADAALEIDYTHPDGTPRDDYIHDEGGDMAGDRNYAAFGGGDSVKFVQYSFWNNPGGGYTQPGLLRMYFLHDLGGDEVIWYADIDTTSWAAGNWYSGMVPFFESTWWTMDGGADWGTDIQEVDEIGFFIQYQPNTSQEYGVGYFGIDDEFIPEPGTYAMLGFAFLSMGVTFRRKLNDSLEKLRKSLKG